MNTLYYGDNLEVLREHIPAESIDLVYLDPPFNSNRNYNVLFARHDIAATDQAQIQAFGDTWRWTAVTEQQFGELVSGGLPLRVADTLSAFRTMLGENDAMAYLVNMTPRLVELHRALKPTGSLYLHCDPTMSHYLKVLLDGIFEPVNFRSEVIWKRTSSHNSANRWGPQHDVILYYVKSAGLSTWNRIYQKYDPAYIAQRFTSKDQRGAFNPENLTGAGVRAGDSGAPWRGINPSARGRHWAVPSMMTRLYESMTGESLANTATTQERLDKLDEQGLIYWPSKAGGMPAYKKYVDLAPGLPLQDMISDIPPVNPVASERLGYPTQKPVALLERILAASSNEDDIVLDPFCGCGTTVDAAIRLGRRWIGIDVTYLAVDLIEKRLRHTHGDDIRDTYQIRGIPRDLAGAQALFEHSPFDFERWAVSLVNAQPNEKQVGDKGVDGVARFPLDGGNRAFGRVLMSVKGGKTVGPQFVRDLLGTIQTEKAQMGVLITMADPTRGVLDAVNRAGTYTHPANGQTFPRVQTITITDLLQGQRPHMPLTVLPYIQATKRTAATKTEALF